eukprot:786796-Alexandrium_andersonii.AAC.1
MPFTGHFRAVERCALTRSRAPCAYARTAVHLRHTLSTYCSHDAFPRGVSAPSRTHPRNASGEL